MSKRMQVGAVAERMRGGYCSRKDAGRRLWGTEWGSGGGGEWLRRPMWFTKESKTNVISTASEKTRCLLPCEVCLTGWTPPSTKTLRLISVFLFSRVRVCVGGGEFYEGGGEEGGIS